MSAELKRRIKGRFNKHAGGQYRDILELQLCGCDCIKNHIGLSALARAIDYCGQTELATLVTVTSAIEEFECGQSSFQKFYDTTVFTRVSNA